MSYGDYVFTLGKNAERTYKGSRLRVMEGLEFFGKVMTALAKVLAAPSQEVSLEGLQTGNMDSKMIGFLIKCLSELDSDLYMVFFKTLLNKTQISVRDGMGTTEYLTAEHKVNEWFSKYPSDLIPFSFNIILENISPFLSESGQAIVLAIKEALVVKPSV